MIPTLALPTLPLGLVTDLVPWAQDSQMSWPGQPQALSPSLPESELEARANLVLQSATLPIAEREPTCSPRGRAQTEARRTRGGGSRSDRVPVSSLALVTTQESF